MERVLITGANRGLGLEFCRQYAERGDAVIATARSVAKADALLDLKSKYPNTVHIRELNVANVAAVQAFGDEVSQLPIAIVINNAGQIGPETHKQEKGQAFGSIDVGILRDLFNVNAVAPLILVQSTMRSLALAVNPRAFVLGSTIGCAAETFGDYYAYRMSKSAAHIAFATLAKDLASAKVKAGVVCPGWVKTDMGGPQASLEIADSVRGMIKVMDAWSFEQTGKFLSYDGRELAY